MGYGECSASPLEAQARLEARARFQGTAQAVFECRDSLDDEMQTLLAQRGQELGLSPDDVTELIGGALAQPHLCEKFKDDLTSMGSGNSYHFDVPAVPVPRTGALFEGDTLGTRFKQQLR